MRKRFYGGVQSGLFLTIFILALVTVVTILPYMFRTQAGTQKGLFTRTESNDPALPNYDIRLDKTMADTVIGFRHATGKDAATVADMRDGFVRGEESLKSRVPTLRVEYNDDIRIPEVIAPDVNKGRAFLTAPESLDGGLGDWQIKH